VKVSSRFALAPQSFYFAILTLVILTVVAPLIGSGTVGRLSFLTVSQSLANSVPIALAVGFTMIIGEFDISVISTYALGSMLAVQVGNTMGTTVGMVAAGAAGLVAGVVQGLIIVGFKISSVPVTLGGYLALWGLTNVIGHGSQAISANTAGSDALLSPTFGVMTVGSAIVVAVAILVWAALKFTTLGTTIHAVGNDRRASRISGVPVSRTIVIVFAASGLMAGLGGAMFGVSYGSATPNVTFGPLVPAVIAAVLGGAGVIGGRGSTISILFGVLTLAFLSQALLVSGLDANLLSPITGLFLVLVATLGQLRSVDGFQRLRLRLRHRRLFAVAHSGILSTRKEQ
jgi:ribose transport system permease protein